MSEIKGSVDKTLRYKGALVNYTLKPVKCAEIKKHLDMEEQNLIDSLSNLYKKDKFLLRPDMVLVWRLFDKYVIKSHRNK